MSMTLLGADRLGSAITRALHAGGADLTVWAPPREEAEDVVAVAGRVASVAEAVAHAQTVLVVLEQPLVRELLEGIDLTGRTVVNYAPGSSADAAAARDLVVAAGGRYVDAVVSADPEEIGLRDTTIYYAGDYEAYGLLSGVLGLLSGHKPFLGLRVGNARALEAAWVGAFESAAVDAFRAAATSAVEEGVAPDAMVDSIDHHLARLRTVLLASVRATA
ncbi:MAG: putative oxidoreductase [Aeromicrobium sp.]|jgi:3-hydroxyisobutyrate dehydrogenase-like beta-hydroxyacid dehydrogenase|nr:putative oxidoreductase [Aeromicrobium sp.]